MLPTDLIDRLMNLPLHAHIMLAVIVASGLACLAVVLLGMLSGSVRAAHAAPEGLPPLPARFPRAVDQIYTGLFVFFLLWHAAAGLFQPGEESMRSLSWTLLLFSLAVQLAIYLPMLIRYAWVHPLQKPTRPWWQYVTMPLLFLALMYCCALLLKLSGFDDWLVRVTQCPEYQDVILIFSKGDSMQKLYITLCAVLIAPMAEECCFRGFLYTTLRRWGGRGAAAVCSALLFGAIHASLAQLAALTIFGIMQCIAYERARSLWLPIAIHMLFNSASLVVTGLFFT